MLAYGCSEDYFRKNEKNWNDNIFLLKFLYFFQGFFHAEVLFCSKNYRRKLLGNLANKSPGIYAIILIVKKLLFFYVKALAVQKRSKFFA